MFDFFSRLLDPSGFVPRQSCGEWNAALIWLHKGSDIMIWLAYLSIPVVLGFFARQRKGVPFHHLFWLFSAFILACGFTHFVDAMMFTFPVYRLGGFVKFITAVVSWATVLALIPAIPRVLAWIDRIPAREEIAAEPPAVREDAWTMVYSCSILLAVLVVVLRGIFDPILGNNHTFILPLTAVVFVAWRWGFGPAFLCLILSLTGVLFLYIEPRKSLAIIDPPDQMVLGMFLFCGIAVSLLGESQRSARRQVEQSLAHVRQSNLELAQSQRATAAALGQLETFLTHAPIGIAFLDPELRFIRINKYLEDRNQLPASEHIGKPVEDVPRSVSSKLREEFRQVLASGEPLQGRQLAESPEEGPFWEVSAFPARGASGGVLGLVVIAQDVTTRVRAAAALKESEARFRTLSEAVPQIVWVTRGNGELVHFNSKWYEYTGQSREQSAGVLGWTVSLHPDDLPRTRERWQLAIRTGDPYEIEYRLGDRHGNYRWFLARGLAVRDDRGTIVQWFGTCTDIDDVKHLQSELQESEERYRTTLASVGDAVISTDTDGRVRFLNPIAEGLTGWTSQEAEGRVLTEVFPIIHETTREAVENPVQKVLREQRIVGLANHTILVSRSGKEIPIDDSAAPIRGAEGVTGVVMVFRDVTERRGEEAAQRDRVRVAALRADIATALTRSDRADVLQQSCEALSRQLDLALSRVWLLDATGQQLIPDATFGQPEEIDRDHRQSVGRDSKLGRIATTRTPYLTNSVPTDPHFADQEWISREKIVAFAGYPLAVENHTFGTLALYSRSWLSGRILEDLAPIADTIAQYLDRRRTEGLLRSSESRFRLLTESIPQIVWNANEDGDLTYVNSRWIEFTGTSLDDARGSGWLASIHPDDAGRLAGEWKTIIHDSSKRFTHELRLRRRDGEYRWFLSIAVPLRRPDGTVDQWIGSMADIDDQKRQAEHLEKLVRERTAALVEQQNFLDAIMDNVADGIVACGADGRLKLFNAASREFHGIPVEGDLAEDWTEKYGLFEADGITPLAKERIPLWRAFQGERLRDVEMVIRSRDGTDRFILASGQPLRDAADHKLGAVVSMRDMTARRNAELQLQATARALATSNAELEQFAYVASHDLQEPLRKIQAFGDRLAQKFRPDLGEQGREYIDRMLSSATRMRTLIDDLLSLSRVTTRGQPFVEVDLNTIVREAVSDLEIRIAQTGGQVDIGPLPTLDGDPGQLRQLFQNLIGNALKFHKPDAPPVVRVSAVRLAEVPSDSDLPPISDFPGWRITVADLGIGFEQIYAERIFEVFQRLQGRGEYEGSGIGLAICRKIVDRHGGCIRARSRPGEGAEFFVDLPQLPTLPDGAACQKI